MPTVEALTGFDHGGIRRRGSKFPVSDHTAKQLARAGLVRIVADHPKQADGATSSASPAAQVSPQTTVKKSARGGKPRQTEASS
ncbi:hypothetical protein A8U91_04737 [Halomonas elongata]|uniref:Uncharacterized protein n=1 Tax=Halomonas elongata TaxID=2746 RepID=A0A1B8P0D5_HALEL|nr:hypothetical protein [Halomonas elongata]OBX35663.1 hypothetical protein A8U91_04737 [Halomonas elongata]